MNQGIVAYEIAHSIVCNGVNFYLENGVNKHTAEAMVRNASEFLAEAFSSEFEEGE